MADSGADRQRRSRKHRAGDHSLCDPARCPHAVTAVTPSRGQRLWQEMHGGLGPAQLVLLQEACRIADRLDRLNDHLDGRGWLTFQAGDDLTEVTVVVDRVLSEARQHAGTLKQLVAELRQSAKRPAANTPGAPGAPSKGAGGIADLTARISARRGAPAG